MQKYDYSIVKYYMHHNGCLWFIELFIVRYQNNIQFKKNSRSLLFSSFYLIIVVIITDRSHCSLECNDAERDGVSFQQRTSSRVVRKSIGSVPCCLLMFARIDRK